MHVPNSNHLPSTSPGVVAPHIAHNPLGIAAADNPHAAATYHHSCAKASSSEWALAKAVHFATAKVAFQEIVELSIPERRMMSVRFCVLVSLR